MCFYVHGDVGKGRSIDIYYPPIHWSCQIFYDFLKVLAIHDS